MFFNNFVLGMVTGDVYRIASVHGSGNDAGRGLGATFLDRLAGLITLSAFAIAGGIFIAAKNASIHKEFTSAAAVLALFTVIFISIFALVISTRLQTICRSVLLMLPWQWASGKAIKLLEHTFMNMHTKHDRIMFMRVACVSVLVQALRIGAHVLCAAALGIFMPYQIWYFFVIIPVIALLMIIPLPLGVKETIAGTLFGAAGFVYHEALVMEFLATLSGIVSSLPGAAAFFGKAGFRGQNRPSPQEVRQDI
jgi:hypothetical protein